MSLEQIEARDSSPRPEVGQGEAPPNIKVDFPVNTVGKLLDALAQCPRDVPLHAIYFVDLSDGKTLTKARSLSISRERVKDGRIHQGDKSVPYSFAVWAHADEDPARLRALLARVEGLERDAAREEIAHGRTIDERDQFQEAADKLAASIAGLTGAEIGEHSSANDPWANALAAIADFKDDHRVRVHASESVAAAMNSRLSASEAEVERLKALLDEAGEVVEPWAKLAAQQPLAHYVDNDQEHRLTIFFDDGAKDAERAPGLCFVSDLARAAAFLARLSEEVKPEATPPYQARVTSWMAACFGDDITNDRTERCFRLFEETLELIQSLDVPKELLPPLIDYVYGRPAGEPSQEVGGTMVCLAALCGAAGLDMDAAAETELARVWTKVEAIRAKHAAKPKDVVSALPGSTPPADGGER